MTSHRHAWSPLVLLVGAIYCLIGRVFALPFANVSLARGAAWMLSIALFVGHIGYERVRLNDTPRLAAARVALAVAIGAAGLALAGMLHSLLTTSQVRPVWFIALVALPVVVATPAYLVALLATSLLARHVETAAAQRTP